MLTSSVGGLCWAILSIPLSVPETNEELLRNAGKLTAAASVAAEFELIDCTRD